VSVKNITSENVVSLPWHDWLQAGDHIHCSHMTAEPQRLLESLAQADLPPDVSIELDAPFSMAASALPTDITLQVMGGMGTARVLAKTHQLEIDRTEYPDLTNQYASGERKANLVLISLARAADGSLHLGASHGAALQAAHNARHVIAEINTAAPVVAGAPWPEDIALTHQIECHYPIVTMPASAGADAVESRIAQQLAALIPNGACLQVGIGSLPEAVLSLLSEHRNLGVHSGMLGDSLYELITCGAINNSQKPADVQFSAIGSVYGSASLYEAVQTNPDVRLSPTTITHALPILQSITNLTAINSAMEVDLAGRVNSETVKVSDGSRRYVGGVGGLPAFVRGALRSAGGQSIIAMPSRTIGKSGPQPRIVKSLEAEVTMDETLADIVVTEHGVARLRGASMESRREQMIAIADPEDRDGLSGS